MSKLKRWILGDVVRRAVQVGVDPSQIDPPAEAGKATRAKTDAGRKPGAGAARKKKKK